jgi:hypothetical protein
MGRARKSEPEVMQRSGGHGVGATAEGEGVASGAAGVMGVGFSPGVAGMFVGVADGPETGEFSPPGEGLAGMEGCVAVLVELMYDWIGAMAEHAAIRRNIRQLARVSQIPGNLMVEACPRARPVVFELRHQFRRRGAPAGGFLAAGTRLSQYHPDWKR